MGLFDRADSVAKIIRTEVKKLNGQNSTQRSFGGSASSGENMFAENSSSAFSSHHAARQYRALKNTVATALRPIVVRFASQPIRVGVTASRKELNTNKSLAYLNGNAFDCFEEKTVKEFAPTWIKSNVGQNITPIDHHPLLDLLANPNEFCTQNALLQCSAASLSLTGRLCWWFDSSGSIRDEHGMSTRIWYVPCHWVSPAGSSSDPFSRYTIRIPSAGEIEVDGRDIFYATIPHPEDPSKAWSVIQSQAASVDTDENILMAQHVSMKNVIRPSLIITAGRAPGIGGSNRNGPRVMLDRDARNTLTEAIKGHYQGVMNYGEPLILDALIEDVKPLIAGPLELDLLNSSGVTQSRIMQGVGTSPVVAGYSENANRSGSVVAHEIFYELVLNPLINLFGQSLDVAMQRRWNLNGKRHKFRVWMDEAKPRDAEQIHQRVEICKSAMRVKEIREYLKSGNLVLEDATPFDEMFIRDFEREADIEGVMPEPISRN